MRARTRARLVARRRRARDELSGLHTRLRNDRSRYYRTLPAGASVGPWVASEGDAARERALVDEVERLDRRLAR